MAARSADPIPFIDLQAQRRALGDRIDTAIVRVLQSGQFIMGPEVSRFEAELAEFASAPFALSCANGTDAIALPLMAWEIGPGDAIFCPSFTFVASAEVIPWFGATPVFVDIDPNSFNMSPASLEAAILAVKAKDALVPRVVIAVDLFGQCADYPALTEIARAHGMKLIADSAQSFGATLHGHHPVHWADVQTTSFFPAKPLGAYGDGGAVLMKDRDLAEIIDSLRIHGKASPSDIAAANFTHDARYWNMRVGMNSRLDAIQAAILREKLTIFTRELEMRQTIAERYSARLRDHVRRTPDIIAGGTSTWAQYTIEVDTRDQLVARLADEGIPTAIYYPLPLHQQECYARLSERPVSLEISEAKAGTVLSLPMHPYLTPEIQDRIIAVFEHETKSARTDVLAPAQDGLPFRFDGVYTSENPFPTTAGCGPLA